MTKTAAVDYHSRRASEELHRGLLASSPVAARIHLKLSSLHFARVRLLLGNSASPRPLLTM